MSDLQKLADIVQLSKADVYRIWAQARENNEKIKNCKRHIFRGGTFEAFGKHECLNCRGSIGSVEAKYYIEGYIAAGGDATVIWPGYYDKD